METGKPATREDVEAALTDIFYGTGFVEERRRLCGLVRGYIDSITYERDAFRREIERLNGAKP